jgi:metal transporter CNNM
MIDAVRQQLVEQALELLRLAGAEHLICTGDENLQHDYSHNHGVAGEPAHAFLRIHDDSSLAVQQESRRLQNAEHHELLVEEVVPAAGFEWGSLIMVVLCLTAAAFCAGLILGILSLDSLHLHIKIRAGSDSNEQRYARILLPLVNQRHLVLVSLLLLNFLADEALPLFLDNLVPTWMAVLLSVVLVVFVSEIIPSAIFIGPDQLRLAALVSPFAYAVIFIFFPISYPIAKLLDFLLDGEDETGNHFNRGELSALVRIQYEARLAAKRRELKERRAQITGMPLTIDEEDIASVVSDLPPPDIHIDNENATFHTAEVHMLEGALALKTTTARDVCTKLRKAYSIPHDMVLDQANLARIYGVGYSRVPVYKRNPKRPADSSGIIGVLITRKLIVVEPSHRRTVSTLPLYQPTCVDPTTNMIEMLSIFQNGSSGFKGGHMALVCEKPGLATAALEQKKPIPREAGVIGIITFEDVIEEMLQEPIYDEGDRAEREAMQRAEWAFQKWKIFVKRRKKLREKELQACEGTPLLGNRRKHNTGEYSSRMSFLPLPIPSIPLFGVKEEPY